MLSLAGAFAVFAAASAHAASFDCARAQRPVEKIICGDAELNAADTRMGQLYRSDLAKLDSHAIGDLRVDQVQWLAWMQQVCRAGKDARPGEAAACMKPLYASRNKLLQVAVVRRDGISFLTRTQYLAAADPEDAGPSEFAGYGTLQASWPQALDADASWAAWNAAVQQHVLQLAVGGNQDKSVGAAPAWNDSLAEGADSTIVARLKSVEHDRVTTGIDAGGMGHGAAHPYETFQVLTWLLPEQRALRATDVFAPGQGWRQAVSRACWAQLKKGEQAQYLYDQVKGPDAKELLDVIDDPTNWTLEPDGLHITYPAYSVAPRVATPEDAMLPWNSLRAVLSPSFVQP